MKYVPFFFIVPHQTSLKEMKIIKKEKSWKHWRDVGNQSHRRKVASSFLYSSYCAGKNARQQAPFSNVNMSFIAVIKISDHVSTGVKI